jgi:rhodanese-related sulfurtransferase
MSTGPTAASAPAAGTTLQPSDFAASAKLPDTVLLDVRTPEEFASGHLPGAVNVDIESADFPARLMALDKSRPYAVYCRSGNRSKAAMTVMQQAGFDKLFDLGGGINAWKSAGGEVVTG